ncbi:GspE/PulE family protein [Patescibacteria group bacterium]
MPKFKEEKQKAQLKEIYKREAEDLAKILADKYKIPYLNLVRITINLDYLKLISEKEARETGCAIIQGTGKKLKIVVKNPELQKTKNLLSELENKNYTYELFLASIPSLEHAWSRYKEVEETSKFDAGVITVTEKSKKEVSTITSFGEFLKQSTAQKGSIKATEILEIILSGGFGLEASDIHIEPEENDVAVRIRLDGVLHEISKFSHEIFKLLASRIKLVSGLKINIRNRAQDGRFTIRTKGVDVEVRVSLLPGNYGESIVMRLLHPKTIGLTLEKLGMQQPVYQMLEKELKKPNGMILTTGPTGSGKTTTLYAFIRKLKSPGIKIITLENPIEYHIKGITQTQVKPAGDYSFEKGLAAILRQDPDVILVGEIRNIETAGTAMHAALTGHLVFSTLHTNNAPATIPRLIDIGIKPNIIAPAINVAMAQRLLRKLCECRKQEKATEKEKNIIENILKDLPKEYKKPNLDNLSIFKAVGCKKCSNIGYKGRVGIYEVFLINDEIENLILKIPSEADIRAAAKQQGMLTFRQDGILKLLEGITSIEEFERVAGGE